MNIKDIINKLFGGLQKYFDTEKELIKLKVVKELARFLGMVFSAIFIITMFHLCVLMVGMWIGFLLSSFFDNHLIGFGITTVIYIIWLIVSVKYKKTLLIKPFTNIVISAMTETSNNEKIEDEQQGA
ncbi:hypothetical protein Oweho_2052 [Owenweeksia hongkongensis DSM 17368]|uniref:Holin-X, holin superfamily III n=1 Tax=Owenweeksia hongkongensis (strain DSM 17368 / CIP 108786 / JCM 12287 / NRRL B-23963 / UST20020801) TaxID=926562 RepID=G8R3H2_OWEHD|nr:hypothetical protein [Owenweeksia hongkongensis]AEV33028.1 hypothetical protein Oweho_2052 [Owenweeksia hongkongensis DSM 17368]